MPSAAPTRFCRRTGAGTHRGPRGDQCGPDISGGRGAGGVTGKTQEPQANAAPPFCACSSLQGAPGAPGPLVLLQVGLQARSSESTQCGALRGRCVSLGWHMLNVITGQEAHSHLHLRHQPCPTRHAPGHPHLVHKCPPVSRPCSPSPAFPHPLGGSAAKTFLRSPGAPRPPATVERWAGSPLSPATGVWP